MNEEKRFYKVKIIRFLRFRELFLEMESTKNSYRQLTLLKCRKTSQDGPGLKQLLEW